MTVGSTWITTAIAITLPIAWTSIDQVDTTRRMRKRKFQATRKKGLASMWHPKSTWHTGVTTEAN